MWLVFMDACTELKPDYPDGFLASLTQRQRVTRNSLQLLPGKAEAGQFSSFHSAHVVLSVLSCQGLLGN